MVRGNNLLMKSTLMAFLLAVALGSIPSRVVAANEGWQRPERPEGIQFPPLAFHPNKPERLVLDNGLVVYLLADPMIPQIRATGYLQAGSLRESAAETGLANLTANVLRVGGTTLTSATDMNRTLDYMGASLEASASRDYAGVSLRVLSKDREEGFKLLAEMLRSPAFPEEKISQRKLEVLENLRRQDDDPSEITRREFRKLIFGDHPYGRDPLGTEETLRSFKRDDLVSWHQKWYRPNLTILSIAGDFDRDEMVGLLKRTLGGWDKGGIEAKYPPVNSAQNSGKRFFIAKDLNQSTVRIGELGIPKNHPDKAPVEVLNFILGSGGFSSRLFNRVRNESGYAYTAVSEFEESLLQGQFLAFLQTQTANTVKAAQLTMDIIREMAETGNITEEELALAKQSKLNDFVFKFETPSDVASQFAQLELYGLPADYWETYRDRVNAVTLEDVKRVAKQYLRPDEMTVLILGNPSIRSEVEAMGALEDIHLPGREAGSGQAHLP